MKDHKAGYLSDEEHYEEYMLYYVGYLNLSKNHTVVILKFRYTLSLIKYGNGLNNSKQNHC